MKISRAGNTIVPAYLALLEKGYGLSRMRADNEVGELWRAERDGNSFVAEELEQLLGLVSIFETRGKNWKATDTEIDRFTEEFPD